MAQTNSRFIAFLALKNVYQKKAYTDVALNRVIKAMQRGARANAHQSSDDDLPEGLRGFPHKRHSTQGVQRPEGTLAQSAVQEAISKSAEVEISQTERSFACELVYGIVRRQRTLDGLIDRLGKKKAAQQAPELRIILHLGLYQLRYLDRIPASAAVNTSVELAKENSLGKLSGVVNGMLRSYIRQAELGDPLELPDEPIARLGVKHSFPDWIVENWLEQLPIEEVDQLLAWFNRSPKIDLRVNILKTSIEEVEASLEAAGVSVERIPHLPQGLRIEGAGAVTDLPGYKQGWWMIQDSSAQLVSHLLDPQPGETIIDACAAPGGKTTHIAELMGDEGHIVASDRAVKRLKKVRENAARLQLDSIQIEAGDSRDVASFHNLGDRVLLDVPCSGLGTLHKRPDIRWRQTARAIEELFKLQQELIEQAAHWVKPQGVLVYATCTLNVLENEKVIQSFLANHANWSIQSPPNTIPQSWVTSSGWIKVYPHHTNMDGFFMVRLVRDS